MPNIFTSGVPHPHFLFCTCFVLQTVLYIFFMSFVNASFSVGKQTLLLYSDIFSTWSQESVLCRIRSVYFHFKDELCFNLNAGYNILCNVFLQVKSSQWYVDSMKELSHDAELLQRSRISMAWKRKQRKASAISKKKKKRRERHSGTLKSRLKIEKPKHSTWDRGSFIVKCSFCCTLVLEKCFVGMFLIEKCDFCHSCCTSVTCVKGVVLPF